MIDTGEHWRGTDLFRMDRRPLQCALQARQQNPPHGQTAIMGIRPGDHMPGCIDATGTAQHPLAILHEPVIGFRLLPVQRADAPAVQRVVGQRLEPCLHLLLGKVKPELEDQRTFIAEHLFQALGGIDRLVQSRILELAMDPPLQHLAVPVAEENPHAPLGREHPPVPPGRWPRQFFVGLLIERADLDQARVHPLVEHLDRLTLAGTFDAIDQNDHREAALLLQFELRFEQRFAQGRDFGVVGFFVDGVIDFGGFKHGRLPSRCEQD
ncbi:hypothetical protein D3C86_1278560 [compost metagenome]